MKMKPVNYVFSNLINEVPLNSASDIMEQFQTQKNGSNLEVIKAFGGGTFNINFQIVVNTNSFHSACLLACFEAQDITCPFRCKGYMYF